VPYPVGYNIGCFPFHPCSAKAAQPRYRRNRTACGPDAACAQGCEQRACTAVVVAGLLRRSQMQHAWREARKPLQAAARIKVADYRRHARRAQFGATGRLGCQRKKVRARPQQLGATHADIAAAHNEHARSAQVSCGFHGGRIVAVKDGSHRLPTLRTRTRYGI
jgi:hypothetical protein